MKINDVSKTFEQTEWTKKLLAVLPQMGPEGLTQAVTLLCNQVCPSGDIVDPWYVLVSARASPKMPRDVRILADVLHNVPEFANRGFDGWDSDRFACKCADAIREIDEETT